MTMQQLTAATAALTAAAEAYNGKMPEINQALNTAAQQVGSTLRNFHVHAETGSDAASGQSSAPLQSIEEAIRRSVWGGMTRIWFQSDCEVTEQINIRVSGLDLRLQGHTVSFAPVAQPQGDRTASLLVGDGNSSGTILVRNGRVHLRNRPSGGQNLRAVLRSFRAAIFLSLDGVELTLEQANEAETALAQCLLSAQQPVSILAQDVLYPESMAGRWVTNAPAGTLPSDAPAILYANLSTL